MLTPFSTVQGEVCLLDVFSLYMKGLKVLFFLHCEQSLVLSSVAMFPETLLICIFLLSLCKRDLRGKSTKKSTTARSVFF